MYPSSSEYVKNPPVCFMERLNNTKIKNQKKSRLISTGK